jgi:hypothetical protein
MKWFFFFIIVGTPFILVMLPPVAIVLSDLNHISEKTQSIYAPKDVTSRTQTVYVREFSNFRPPNGAPVFYVPFPNTLCMMGEGSHQETRIIYERTPGACSKLMKGIEEL